MFTGVMCVQKENTEKKKYKKKNEFKINIIFNEKGEELEKVIERAFGNYCLKKIQRQIMVLNEIVWYNSFKSINIISYIFIAKGGKSELYNNE